MDLQGLSIPVIYVFSHANDPNALTLLPDDEGGARMATEHLIERGRRRIAHVTGPERFEAVRLRQSGYMACLASAGLGSGTTLHGPWSEAWGRAAMEQLLDGSERPDAVFCGNDQIARGCADTLREAGLDVPGDVGLCGFDKWQVMTEASRPPLTSVDMKLIDLGCEAGLRMAHMIDGEIETGIVRRPCELVVRASTGN